MSHRVRVGLAGLGRTGRIHAASLAPRWPSAELACVADADAGMGRQVADRVFQVGFHRRFDGLPGRTGTLRPPRPGRACITQ